MSSTWATIFVLAAVSFLWLYIKQNDRKLSRIPPDALNASPARATPETVKVTDAGLQHDVPHPALEQLPPRTGRRYVVVGGAGFLGGHIVLELLARGESPKQIRVLDINPPLREDLLSGPAVDVDFRLVDVADRVALLAAFNAPWPDDVDTSASLSVFHTASTIRFYERHAKLLARSEHVNVHGTRNVIDAARAAGADVLIYTSSGSVATRKTRFLLWPWEPEPEMVVQHLGDDDVVSDAGLLWSNYAISKGVAEKLVREADATLVGEGMMRTGCIRPSNGVYGLGGDVLAGAFLVRKLNPTWIPNIVHNCIAAENCALAHLLYEQRLIELRNGSRNPDIGGQTFTVCDPGPPPTYGDVYLTLTTLTNGECYFPLASPTLMLLLSHFLEAVYLARELALSTNSPLLRLLAAFVPRLGADVVNLQPSLFGLTMVHLVFDDSRARLPPEEGGLGYRGALSTIEGMCRLVNGHRKGGGGGPRSEKGGFGLGLLKAQRGLRRMWSTIAGGRMKVE